MTPIKPNELRILLRPTIVSVAAAWNVKPQWITAIIEQESGFDHMAVRYEPQYKWLYKPEKFSHGGLSLETEIQTQKMSWGLGQIMGALAREQGHLGAMAELLNPELNVLHIGIRLAALQKYSALPEYIFAGYNGGPGAMRKLKTGLFSNQKYVDGIKSKLV